ncbi:MAG: beta-lactamase family protein [Candidatus Rokubacteria bacterium]|nr:beta-lactamase family protein [Candidatus Rokubacteria bacterium]
MRLHRFAASILGVLVSVLAGVLIHRSWPREYFPDGSGETERRLDAYLRDVMASRPVPGLAVGIVKGTALIYSRGFGLRHLAEAGAVEPGTIFHTASVSKTLVALGLMQLVERGQVDLDAPIARYLPYFRLADPRFAQCTIRQALSHTAGLPADVEGGAWWESPEDDPGALERYVRSLEARPLVAAPGEGWRYSNIGYEVLGDVIAKVSGMSFEDYMRVHILEPLGMAASTFLAVQAPERLAWPHRGSLLPVVGVVYPYHRAHAPSSTLKSNVPDLARWLAAHLDRGEAAGGRLLARATMEGMWEPQAAIEGAGADMTLGWFLRRHRGSRVLLHAGRDPGFNALVAFLPDRGVGVILLSNYDGQSAFEMVEIADGLLDVGQGRAPRLPRTSILVPLAKTLSRGGVPAVVEEYRRLKDDNRYSSTHSDLSTLGHELFKQGRLEEAIQLYSLNAAEHPDYFAPYLFLAETHLKAGDERRALDFYRKGLECDPEGRWGFPLSEYRIERLETLLAEEARR